MHSSDFSFLGRGREGRVSYEQIETKKTICKESVYGKDEAEHIKDEEETKGKGGQTEGIRKSCTEKAENEKERKND
jgi:hypothetical protein